MTTMEALVQGIYGRSDLLQRIEARLRNAGVDPQKPGFRDLHPFDQLHGLGILATEEHTARATVRNMPKGVLFLADTEVVKAFCRVAVRVDELQRVLNSAIGRPDWGSAAEHRNLDRALLLLTRLAGELGLTPAARPRLQVAPPPRSPDPNDPWAMLRLVPGGKADPEPA